MIDDLIDSLTTFKSLADPEGEEVLLYQLAGDISTYMGMICDDPECGCGGLTHARCTANKLVASLLDGVVDGIGGRSVWIRLPVEGARRRPPPVRVAKIIAPWKPPLSRLPAGTGEGGRSRINPGGTSECFPSGSILQGPSGSSRPRI